VSDELLITPTWPVSLSKPDVAIQSTTRFVAAVVVPGDHEKLVSDVISVPVVRRFGSVDRYLSRNFVNLPAMYPPRSIAICLILLCGGAAPALHAQETLYLKERVAVTTKVGVTGLAPGTGVRLISENGNALRVTDGTNNFDVSKGQLTGNINEARLSAQNYYAAEQASAQAFNAEVVRRQQEHKRALEQQQKAAAEQRQRQMQQEQIAARQQQQQLEAQRKQEAKIASQKQAREQQQRKRRTTSGRGYSWESYTRYNAGGGYEKVQRSGDAQMGSYHHESHGPRSPNAAWTDNVTDASWRPR
jgi:hypothetical protein